MKMVEEDSVDGIFISCAADPGLNEVRKRVNVPVIGAGSATAAVALTLSNKVGVLGITEEVPRPYIEILGSKMVGYAKPKEVKTTVDIKDYLSSIVPAAEYLKRLGSEVIALACTGYATQKIAPFLQEKIGIPVVDPIVASGSILYAELIRSKNSNMSATVRGSHDNL